MPGCINSPQPNFRCKELHMNYFIGIFGDQMCRALKGDYRFAEADKEVQMIV